MSSSSPEHLLVLYDENCALCRRCRQWLETQATHVTIEFLAAGSPAAKERFASVPWLGADLVVVDEHGNVWVGPAAFIVCLWATVDYRVWSYRLSGRAFAPLAERFFHVVSSNRSKIGAVVGTRDCPDGRCRHLPAPTPAPAGAAGWAPPPPHGAVSACHACGAPVWSNERRCWSCGTVR